MISSTLTLPLWILVSITTINNKITEKDKLWDQLTLLLTTQAKADILDRWLCRKTKTKWTPFLPYNTRSQNFIWKLFNETIRAERK